MNDNDPHPFLDPRRADSGARSLEARLVPLVRCALRNGTGLPGLVGWVNRSWAALHGGNSSRPPADRDRAAPELARMLGALLARGGPPPWQAGRLAPETVVGS